MQSPKWFFCSWKWFYRKNAYMSEGTALSGKWEKGLTCQELSARTLEGPGNLAALSRWVLGTERTVSSMSWACCGVPVQAAALVHSTAQSCG